MKLGFIGLGNMAKAMIGGILKKEVVPATDIMGCAKSEASKEYASGNWGILIGEDNIQVARFAEILVLAVKPQVLPRVVEQIKDAVSEDTVIVSIAAGVSMDSLGRMFGRSLKFVRCMPNTPALVGMGCTGVCCNELVTRDEMQQSLSLLQSFGLAEEVPEKLMDAVVGVSGSSPGVCVPVSGGTRRWSSTGRNAESTGLPVRCTVHYGKRSPWHLKPGSIRES